LKNHQPLFDTGEVSRALDVLLPNGQVTELRALDATLTGDRSTGTITGYFDDSAKLLAALGSIKSAKGVYIVVNPVKSALLARAANRIKRAGKGETTSDGDIEVRRWLLIDCDPRRPAGISATPSEHEAAIQRSRDIYAMLHHTYGWPDPIAADSGNGSHLLYRIDLPLDDAGLVRRCLAALAAKFDDDTVTIDTGVFNPARIWKLYGTLACKGDSTPERSHRMSRILNTTNPLVVVPRSLLDALAEDAPTGHLVETDNAQHTTTAFDIDQFIIQHGFEVDGPEPWQGGRRWVFRRSPLCEHHDGAAFIAQHASGALIAKCHHNSCSWTWADLRARFGPRAERCSDDPQHREETRSEKRQPKHILLSEAAKEYIDRMRHGQTGLIETGIAELDYAIGGGVEFGEMIIAAARPSHGKSAFALQCAHHWTSLGLPTLIVSEEMSPLALGKRTLQFVSDVPMEHWPRSVADLEHDLGEYVASRAHCIVSEACITPAGVVESIERAVNKHNVKAVVVDYAQLLQGQGRSRYEQVSQVSNVLREAATRFNVLLLALCQLNREVEKRAKFIPCVADIRDAGTLEQDADVIFLLAWPHRVDAKQPPTQYQIFVAKNRNRPINQPLVVCRFDPSRQTISESEPSYCAKFDTLPT
jgi:hypothetical protein